MPTDPDHRGAQRRALVRRALGKPGSVNRWIAGTAVWLFACGLVSTYVSWIARIIIFVFAVLLAVAALRARALAIGDEDEFRAAVRRDATLWSRQSDFADDEVPLEPEHWLSRRGRVFDGVPPAPILEEEQSAHSSGSAESEAGEDADAS